MKIFVLAPRENWICDRIYQEWLENCSEITTQDPREASVLWLLAGWCWRHIPVDLLISKKVVVTVHHIVPEKFTKEKHADFLQRDQFTNAYHVPNAKTAALLGQITKKPIYILSYWYDKKKWSPLDRKESRKNIGLEQDKFVIGSFQRDTEGSDLKTPKLEKGPDRFCNLVSRIKDKDIHVLLGGWRRQYVISRLQSENIPFTYIELADLETLRTMYGACDLYVIASRYEGGPQSCLEASAMRVPIVSSDVGIVSNILSKNCIIDVDKDLYYPTLEDIDIGYEQVQNFEIKSYKQNYISLFRQV